VVLPNGTKFVSKEHMNFLVDYWETFGSERGQRVLNDMKAKYCDSCFDENTNKMAFLNGQRQVILEIEEVLSMRSQDIKEEEDGYSEK
jgi:hypothetical protein